jgi:hypothetical protein
MVRIEGFSIDEPLALPKDELDAFVFTGRPVVARGGSAEILIESANAEAKYWWWIWPISMEEAKARSQPWWVLSNGLQRIATFAALSGLSVQHAARIQTRNWGVSWSERVSRCGEHPEFGECYYKKTTVSPNAV